jgi:hypothetical protein
MKVEINKVYSFIMNSGQEVIGKVAAKDDSSVTIANPLTIGMGPKGPVMMPAFQTVNPNTTVTLNTSSVAIYAESDDEIKDKVLELTTGLTVPPQKKIVLG